MFQFSKVTSLFIVFLAAFPALATWQKQVSTSESKDSGELVWTFKSEGQRDAYFVVYSENDVWTSTLFEIAEDGFHEKVWNFEYRSQTEALAQVKWLQNSYKPKSLKNSTSLAGKANPPLWKVTQSWNWDWEKKFAAWIIANVDAHFFEKYKVATDCADVPVYLRWIFARENGLPALTSLMGSGQLMTQDSVRTEWLKYPTAKNWWEDKRFRVASNYITAYSNTHSVVRDSYPIAIHANAFFEGAFHIALHGSSGHTQFVYRYYPTEEQGILPFAMVASNMPRIVRVLFEGPFWDSGQPEIKKGGFIRLRWPVKKNGAWVLTSAESMPYFSLEQYSPEFMQESSFALNVMLRLRPNLDFQRTLEQIIASLQQKFQERVPVVKDGYEFCQKNNCAPGTGAYEDWSTPSRDERIGSIIGQVDQIVSIGANFGIPTLEIWKKKQKENFLELDGNFYNLEQLILVWQKQVFSSDPRVSPSRRWAVQPESLVTNLHEKTAKAISEREMKISQQGNQCRAGCLPGSNEYKKWETYALDSIFQNYSSFRGAYCHLFSKNDCDVLTGLLSRVQVSVENTSMSLEDFFRDAFFMVSDPRVITTDRWFGRKKLFDITSLPYEFLNTRIQASSGSSPSIERKPAGHWMSVRNAQRESLLYNLETREEIKLEGMDGWTVHNTLPFAAGSRSESLVIMNLNNKSQTVFPWIPKSNFWWFVEGSFALQNQGTLTLYTRQQNGWAEPRVFEPKRAWVQSGANEGTTAIAYQKNEKIHLLNLENSTEVTLPGTFVDAFSVRTLSETAHYAYLRVYYYDPDQQHHFVDMIFDKMTKTTKPGWIEPDSNGEVDFSEDRQLVVIKKTSGSPTMTLHLVGEGGGLGPVVVEAQDIRHSAPGQFYTADGMQLILYKFENGKLTSVESPPKVMLLRQLGIYFYGYREHENRLESCIFDLKKKPVICGLLYSIVYTNQHLLLQNYERTPGYENDLRVSLFAEITGFDIPLSTQRYEIISIDYPFFGSRQGVFALSRPSETLILKPKAQ